jgi:membrane-bound serine protease (ClpP class)
MNHTDFLFWQKTLKKSCRFVVMKKIKFLFVASFILLLFTQLAIGQQNKMVYKFNLKEMVSPGIARQLNRAMTEAEAKKVDLFLIHMNTYGGLLDAADSIRTTLINTTIPTAVFIDNNAASAGALISIACNRIYMRSGASIGAATVVNEQAEAMPDKYQSYMRGMMRSTAEKRGRNPKIAEAMVDPRTYIEGINDSGKVLTFTTDEAIANIYCNGKTETIAEVLKQEKLENATILTYMPTVSDRVISFFMNPAISGFLILIIMAGIYFEFQAPGTVFPIAAAALAALLYFTPLYLEGLAANWEILLVVVGVILLAVEIFVLPGFGFAGVSGISLIVLGLILSLLNNVGFDFTFTTNDSIVSAVTAVLSGTILSVVLLFFVGGKLTESKQFKKMVLSTVMESKDGYVSVQPPVEKGMRGKTIAPLKPAGNILVNGKVYTASVLSGYLDSDVDVEVIETGANIIVKRVL